jgi:anti-anti-sigma regulatory factor
MNKRLSKDFSQLTGEVRTEDLAGAFFQGVYYYDMANVKYINNTGIADLINLVKDWMDQGTEVKFINVRDEIKNEFKRLGLVNIIDFE